MNRKTRRATEKTQKKAAPALPAASALNFVTDPAEFAKQTGLRLRAEGKLAEAVTHLRRALELNNDFADAHLILSLMAAQHPELQIDMKQITASVRDKPMLIASYHNIIEILKDNNQHDESARCYEELTALSPDNDEILFEYGRQLMKLSQFPAGLNRIARAINANPRNLIAKSFFTLVLQSIQVKQYDPEIKQAISHCFENIYEAHLRTIFPAWATTINASKEYNDFAIARLIANDEGFFKWLDMLTDVTPVGIKDPFILNGIRKLVMTTLEYEQLLRRFRSYLCLRYDTLLEAGRISQFEAFLCALAEQSWLNEFVMSQPLEEQKIIDGYAKIIATPAGQSRTDFKTLCALVGAYQPLNAIFPDPAALAPWTTGDEAFSSMVKTQITDPATEKSLWPTLPNFGALANSVSKAVQQMYEENPYPRWVGSAMEQPAGVDWLTEADRMKPMHILVAGCGTGQQVLGTAARHPNSTIVAIDLSRASLAYAKRKAMEAGVADRINFVHADILSMADWPEMFDMMECSGVLHHMEDPMAGWTALTSRLKKGGYFKVGLYSEIARRKVVEGRDFVAKNGFPSTVEGIRACRDAIIALPADNKMRTRLTTSADFYTISVVRDLIFHVQEHRMTLPQIKDMTTTLGLSLTRMELTKPEIAKDYDTRFPDDPQRKNLDHWHAFEQDNPDTFIAMYQFWCRKK